MNRKFLSYSLTIAMMTTLISVDGFAKKKSKKNENAGTIAGAIIGGIVGSQIGKGDGKTSATGIGIIVGAVLGNEIGKDLDESDRRAFSEAQRDNFRRPVGEETDWDGSRYGSRTGSHGRFVTTREGYRRNNSREVCREYRSVIVTRNKTVTKTGIACSSTDGSWREVNSKEVVFNGNSHQRPDVRPNPRP
ncbi:MAG: glycine zipper 2TM domain-containing protein, partial [Bdellovibrionales bacterium]|nr:glycine zipper 2TM domain-containing protein [Bdellovibrionales bacterium]